jgi:bacteriocin-like protein
MATAISTVSMTEQVPEPARELTEDELAHVSGGIVAILIDLGGSHEAPPRPACSPMLQPHCPGYR